MHIVGEMLPPVARQYVQPRRRREGLIEGAGLGVAVPGAEEPGVDGLLAIPEVDGIVGGQAQQVAGLLLREGQGEGDMEYILAAGGLAAAGDPVAHVFCDRVRLSVPGIGLEGGGQAGQQIRVGKCTQNDAAAPEILCSHSGSHLLGAEAAVLPL